MTTTATTAKPTNYTPVQEAFIRSASDAATAEGRKLNKDDAERIANDPVMAVDGEARKPRSIVAKITNMKLPYAKQVPLTKTGDPVAHKKDLVAKIEKIVDADLDGLDKAPKDTLKAILAFAEASREAVREAA